MQGGMKIGVKDRKSMRNFLKFGLFLQLGIVVSLCILWGDALPLYGQSALYAISLTLRNILFFSLPFIIFSYLFRCILSFERGALLLVGLLVGCVCLSNFISTLVAYGVSWGLLTHGLTIAPAPPMGLGEALQPLWNLSLPSLIPNEGALFSGLFLGVFFSLYPHKKIEKLSLSLKAISDLFLNKIFMKTMPLFMAGFIIKMQHDGILPLILHSYLKIFLAIFITQVLYIFFLYGVASKFQLPTWALYLKNTLPPALTGFSTMSSAAALPLSIKGAEENGVDPGLARAISPATVSIHLIGDSLGIPIMAMAILQTFGLPMPGLMAYLPFAFFFVLAKFAVAAVPGGGILVMIPILESYLGFSPSMSVLITAVYILFDPVVTSANVMGNGAFTIFVSRFFQKVQARQLKRKSPPPKKALV
jgi:Na+/H+-dicarboxylate symporter